MTFISAPPPDLRIVLTQQLYAHEDHDSQRSEPLIKRISTDAHMINPPIVARINDEQYVILDGANRVFSFSELGYPHILVQVVSYDSGFVQLATWNHVVCRWNRAEFTQQIAQLPEIQLLENHQPDALAHITLRDGQPLSLHAPAETVHERNQALRNFVRCYQKHAVLHRSAENDPAENWRLHPDALALVVFPEYHPNDIIAAAEHHAFLPAGVSRHIVEGRAIRVNFPMDVLRDTEKSLDEKNQWLQAWIQEKVAKRQVRYYAESTYQFDE